MRENEKNDIEIRGSLGMEDVVRLQMNRCNASAYEPDQTLFVSNVKVLRDILPPFKRKEIYERREEYEEEKERAEYKYWCGRPMTDTKRIIKYIATDYHKLYQMVLDLFFEVGYTYQTTQEMVEERKSIQEEKIKNPMKEGSFDRA